MGKKPCGCGKGKSTNNPTISQPIMRGINTFASEPTIRIYVLKDTFLRSIVMGVSVFLKAGTPCTIPVKDVVNSLDLLKVNGFTFASDHDKQDFEEYLRKVEVAV
jgi:hypothetical protein